MRLAVESTRDLIACARGGQDKVLRAVENLSDLELDEPSLLPGWERRHVVAHLVGNARGQHRMLVAARNAGRAAQYPGGALGRAAEIDLLAARSPSALRSELVGACEALAEIWDSMPTHAWERPTNALTQIRPAWVSVWARWRETEIHHVDLDVGFRSNDWPSDFVELLAQRLFGLDGIAALNRRLPVGAAVVVGLSHGPVHLGPGDSSPTVLNGADHELVAWALGRPCADLDATADGRSTAPPTLTPFA